NFAPSSREYIVYDVVLSKTIITTQRWDTLRQMFFDFQMKETYDEPSDSTTVTATYRRDTTCSCWIGVNRSTKRAGESYIYLGEKWSASVGGWMPLARTLPFKDPARR